MNMKEIVKLFLPPILVAGLSRTQAFLTNRFTGGASGNQLTGNYATWDEALAASTGYDNEIILAKTRDALLKVKNGQAVYERDSVLFDQVQYSWPLLVGLMRVAAKYEGNLNVLDFGGSLGSTYFQNRAFLHDLKRVRWNIVEQQRQVEIGKAEFEDERLKFYKDIHACLADTQPNLILLSGVLQYLEHPHQLLQDLWKGPCSSMIIDRTPFWAGLRDQLCVQHIPPSIYTASYPSWIFSKHRFREMLPPSWRVVEEFENPDRLKGPVAFSYQGMILARQ